MIFKQELASWKILDATLHSWAVFSEGPTREYNLILLWWKLIDSYFQVLRSDRIFVKHKGWGTSSGVQGVIMYSNYLLIGFKAFMFISKWF